MPLARHDMLILKVTIGLMVSTHMPLARHDNTYLKNDLDRFTVSTHMPLARHDVKKSSFSMYSDSFYSHASCEA